MDTLLSYAPEVKEAQKAGRAIVALESTIITHGMPYPQNYETARAVEHIVRERDATPATIAVMNGRVQIGLTDAKLKDLAQIKGARKVSRADIAIPLIDNGVGATTVAATMLCSELAGIQVFATGGIGGVHRGAELSFDVSADLTEFTKSNVTVVAAGAKAILDIPKTLEVLETLGVPVITFGQDDFPAFWSKSSGLKSPLRLDSAKEIAVHAERRRSLGQCSGQLIANPIPAEHELSRSFLRPIIEDALAEAAKSGIDGKSVTPFLLAKIFEKTKGKSLDANIELVKNNARLAADIANSFIG